MPSLRLSRVLVCALAFALFLPVSRSYAALEPSNRLSNRAAVIKRDLTFLGVAPQAIPQVERLLPGSAQRVLGAAVDEDKQRLLLWIVTKNGSERPLSVRLPREVIDGMVGSGVCAESKRCEQVLCPICGARRSVGSDLRAVVFQEEYASPLGLMQKIRKVEHRRRDLERRIIDLQTEMGQHLNHVGFDGGRERTARVRQLQAEIRQAKADRRSLKRERSHLFDDFNDWHRLLGSPYRLKADINTELRVLGLAANIIGRILRLIPHPVARVLGLALNAAGTGLSLWLVMTDESEERFTIPIDQDESRLLVRSGICNDVKRCRQVRCPACGWKEQGDQISSDPRVRVFELEYGSPLDLARAIRAAENRTRELERDLDAAKSDRGNWSGSGFKRSTADRLNSTGRRIRDIQGRIRKEEIRKDRLEDDSAAWRKYLKKRSR